MIDFLMDDQNFNGHPSEYYTVFSKFLTGKFIDCFGTTKHMRKFTIRYDFDMDSFEIVLRDDGYVRLYFKGPIKNDIQKLIDDTAGDYKRKLEMPTWDETNQRYNLIKQKVYKIFYSTEDVFYIPASRSLLATIPEHIQGLSFKEVDLIMQEFISLTRRNKNRFGNKIPEVKENYVKTVKGQINDNSLNLAYGLIKQILKADYINDSDGEKIYYSDTKWVKLMFASSGQQESLWILMTLYVMILEGRKSFVIIEEPEAHLFPDAQKNMMELISLLINATDSKVIITTHSPYILTSLNLLLYSFQVEKQKSAIINKAFRMDPAKTNAFLLEKCRTLNFKLRPLMNKESKLIDATEIDRISGNINEIMDNLIDIDPRG